MELIDILIIILLIIASILGLYLIKLVKRLFTTIDVVETELKELDSKITPLISDLQEMTDSGNHVINIAKEQIEYIDEIRKSIKGKFGGLIHKNDGKTSPQSNALNLVANLKAIIKGTSTFISELKDK